VAFNALRRGFSAFNKATTKEGKIISALFLVLIAWVLVSALYDSASDAYASYRAGHLSSAEHLRIAHDLCHDTSNIFMCSEPNTEQAISHLEKIQSQAPEYAEASKLLASIQSLREKQRAFQDHQERARAALVAKQREERNRLMSQSEDESRVQMWKNVGGQSHDAFTCGTSAASPIMSFDYGHYWWTDDGRCASQQAAQQQQREEGERRQREQEQKKLDEDAELSSYWPTTIRVDTDMNSFWLNNEERKCQTYPDAKGRVEVVACDASGSHRDHNIPVKFWGSVDRNTISAWKCRRESDNFVCRAID
jgi:hypothetical protein